MKYFIGECRLIKDWSFKYLGKHDGKKIKIRISSDNLNKKKRCVKKILNKKGKIFRKKRVGRKE